MGRSRAAWSRSRPTRGRRTWPPTRRGGGLHATRSCSAPPGHLYVYLIYGLHLCANVVCGPGTKPEAVLLRAAEITAGHELARRRRGTVPDARLAAGPGNLGAAFGLARAMNGLDLLAGPMRLAHGSRAGPHRAVSAHRRRHTPANGRRGRCASRSLMTRTAPDAEPAAGAAADPGTLRALEFDAIVEMLSELTAFGPSRELAAAIQPMADARHVSLLQDQTDEAVRLLDDQAQASIGGARDVRAPIGRARRGGRLTAMELLDVAETREPPSCSAHGWPAGRRRTWRSCATSWIRHPPCASGSSAASTTAAKSSTPPPPSWRPSASACAPPRTESGSG